MKEKIKEWKDIFKKQMQAKQQKNINENKMKEKSQEN